MGLGHWLSNAVKTAGRAVGSGVHAISDATGKITHAVFKIPFIGPFFHAVWTIETVYYAAALQLAEGKRIDKVAMGTLKTQIAAYKEVAPYVQTIIAVIPGVGPEVSGAIGAGVALAEGKNIDQALIAAAAGAVPGGAFAVAALKVGADLISGKKLAQAGVDALVGVAAGIGVQIPPEAQTLLNRGLDFAQKLAKGEKLSDAAFDEAVLLLPADPAAIRIAARATRDVANGKHLSDILIKSVPGLIPGLTKEAGKQFLGALGPGMALGQGQNLQNITVANVKDAGVVGTLVNDASKIIGADKILQAARAIVPNRGFDIGIGMVNKRLNEFQMRAMRATLSAVEQKAFDTAVSLHISRVSLPPSKAKPGVQVGFFVTQGMQGANEKQKAAMMTTLSTNQEARSGAVLAVKQIAAAREGFIPRALRWMGLRK